MALVCIENDQIPAGIGEANKSAVSVINVAITPLELDGTDTATLCSAAVVAVGLHCLYVGVPTAVLVLLDRFR